MHLGTLLAEDSAGSTITKLWLMPALLIGFVLALSSLGMRPVAVLVLGSLGVLLSWAGDSLLASPGDLGFLLGLGAFLLAHVTYLVLFARPLRERALPRSAAVYLVWWVALLVVVGPSVGVLLVPVAVYGLVLAVSTGFALGTNPTTAVGALAFLASDTLLSFKLFVPGWEFYPIDAIIMTLYCAGQLLIVVGAVSRARTIQTQPAR